MSATPAKNPRESQSAFVTFCLVALVFGTTIWLFYGLGVPPKP